MFFPFEVVFICWIARFVIKLLNHETVLGQDWRHNYPQERKIWPHYWWKDEYVIVLPLHWYDILDNTSVLWLTKSDIVSISVRNVRYFLSKFFHYCQIPRLDFDNRFIVKNAVKSVGVYGSPRRCGGQGDILSGRQVFYVLMKTLHLVRRAFYVELRC